MKMGLASGSSAQALPRTGRPSSGLTAVQLLWPIRWPCHVPSGCFSSLYALSFPQGFELCQANPRLMWLHAVGPTWAQASQRLKACAGCILTVHVIIVLWPLQSDCAVHTLQYIAGFADAKNTQAPATQAFESRATHIPTTCAPHHSSLQQSRSDAETKHQSLVLSIQPSPRTISDMLMKSLQG